MKLAPFELMALKLEYYCNGRKNVQPFTYLLVVDDQDHVFAKLLSSFWGFLHVEASDQRRSCFEYQDDQMRRFVFSFSSTLSE